jgi:hypothetical protein
VATGVSATSIALTWNPSPDPTVTGYDVYEKVWVNGVHSPKGSGGTPGHYSYVLRASKLTTASDTVGGLTTGSVHDYVVTAVAPSGQSAYSLDASSQTWVAPSFPNGPNAFLLSSGALCSGPVSATAGLTTQLSLLISGNPLTFSVASGPSTVKVVPKTGVVTYTPGAGDVGTVDVTFKATNPLGTVAQTIRFNVGALNPHLASPGLSLYAATSTYSGQSQPVSPRVVGSDGVTLVAGTVAVAYNGGRGGYPLNVGTYQVLLTFTSTDPIYNNATLLTTFTITRATPAFGSLSSPTIAQGTATTVLTGHIAAGTAVPAGDAVVVTLGGVSQSATVDANGNFSASFATGRLPVGTDAITYAFAGDANFNAAPNATSALTVIPTSPPQVTLNPRNVTITAGDPVSFTAAATGVPAPSVQWQVSTDGGKTFTNITGNTSAQTTTLTFVSNAGQNGYKYRAVFTNSVGMVTTTVATLTVELDTGGGGD